MWRLWRVLLRWCCGAAPASVREHNTKNKTTPPARAPATPHTDDAMDTTLLLSLLLPLLIAAVFYFAFFGKSSKASGDKVLLFGPMGSGKTSLSLQLRFGKIAPTYTSLQKTVSRCQVQSGDQPALSKSITLVDMPGTGRLRTQLLSEAASASVLACVLDGTQLAAQCKEAAGMLFDVLALEAVQRRSPAILVVVNKSEGRSVGHFQVGCMARDISVGAAARVCPSLDLHPIPKPSPPRRPLRLIACAVCVLDAGVRGAEGALGSNDDG